MQDAEPMAPSLLVVISGHGSQVVRLGTNMKNLLGHSFSPANPRSYSVLGLSESCIHLSGHSPESRPAILCSLVTDGVS
eukprot:18882_6